MTDGHREEAPETDREISLEEYHQLRHRESSEGPSRALPVQLRRRMYPQMRSQERLAAPDRCVYKDRTDSENPVWVCFDRESAEKCDMPVKGYPVPKRFITGRMEQLTRNWRGKLNEAARAGLSENDMTALVESLSTTVLNIANMRNPEEVVE